MICFNFHVFKFACLQFTVTLLEPVHLAVMAAKEPVPMLHVDFKKDGVRRPHMNNKGRCAVDLRILDDHIPAACSTRERFCDLVAQLEVACVGPLADRILPACQLVGMNHR